MKITLFFVCFILSFSTQAKYLSGEGEFLSIASDSNGFIKKQLIFSAQKNILNDYLLALDLSPQKFWQGFESLIEKKLESKVSWLDKKITDSNQNGDFDSLVEWETKKRELVLKNKAKYLNNARVFNSYSIISRSQSLSNPSLKFIKMKVKISKPRLKSLFFKLTKQDLSRVFKNLYVYITFEDYSKFYDKGINTGATYYDERSLVEVKLALQAKWEQFLKNELAGVIENVTFVDSEYRNQLDQYLIVSPKQELKATQRTFNKDEKTLDKDGREEETEPENKNGEELPGANASLEEEKSLDELPSELKGDLYLKVSFDFKKAFYDKEVQKGEYLLSGGLLLFDLNGGNIIYNKDFSVEEKTLFSTTTNNFYSALATKIYNLPLGSIRDFKSHLSKYPSINNRVVLKVTNPSNINDIFTLSEFLSISGANFNFKTNNLIAIKDSIFFDLHFNGEKEDALNKFRQWESKNIGGDLMMGAKVENESVEINLNKQTETLKDENNEDERDTSENQSI